MILDYLFGLLCSFASLAMLFLAMATTPTRAVCPPGWYLNGVRSSGAYCCVRTPVGDPDWDGTWQRPERSVQPPGELCGRIYCTGGSRPIVVNERVAGCQR